MKTIQETVSYAQNREDLIVAGFFGAEEDGFYVDVGANEPDRDSVTRLFYERGWRGINIEPLAQHFRQLQQQRPHDTNLNVGVGNKPGEMVLREYTAGTGLSTLSDVMKEEYKDGKNSAAIKFVDHKVRIQTLAQIFSEQKVDRISFMKVDVEGFEYEVLAGNDWEKYRPELLCIEANHIEHDWHPILEKHNYKKVFFDGLNEYFVADEHKERAEQFSYVDSIVMREPIVMYRLLPKIEDYNRMQQAVRDFEHEAEIKQQYILHLEGVINEITPLRRHAVRQVKGKLRKVHHKIVRFLGGSRGFAPNEVGDSEDDLVAQAQASDTENFQKYNDSTRPPLLLQIYLGLCSKMVALLKWVLRFRKK